MNWSQFISTVIFIVGIFAGVWGALYLIYLFKQKLPEHTRLALEQFARQAVWQVEQQNRTLSGSAKKQLAVTSVTKLFGAFGLPAPPMEAIDIAIEAAVYFLSHAKVVESDNPPRIDPPSQG